MMAQIDNAEDEFSLRKLTRRSFDHLKDKIVNYADQIKRIIQEHTEQIDSPSEEVDEDSGLIDEKDSKESVFTESPNKNGWLCSKYTLLSPIRPFCLQSNAVGFGTILGFGYHANFSKNIMNSTERSLDGLDYALLAILLGAFAFTLSAFLFQLIFWAFRCYNRKLIRDIGYQYALDGLMQVCG
jgi:hypothetical protein